MPMTPARFLIILGLVLIAAGLLWMALPKIPFLGRLPGDIVYKRGHFTFYFPLATSLLVSLVLTILLRFFSKK
jgi:hypothetical protein